MMPHNDEPLTSGPDRQISGGEELSEEQGRISVADAYLLADEWRSEATYGGKSMSELAEAVDMPDAWRDDLVRQLAAATSRWGPTFWWLLGVGALIYGVSHHTAWLVLSGAGFVAVAANRFGAATGRAEGYSEGLQTGYVTAVFWYHGVPPEGQQQFWDHYHQAREDGYIADRVRATKKEESR